ncbi:MAG: PAS domain-containing protein [Sulfuritalea sp.]|nr:PAS domain-containing protein [Sulfuritalea sp.]
MIGRDPGLLQPAEAGRDSFRVAATSGNGDEYGTLIVDRAGRVLSCGEPAGQIFRIRHAQMVGRQIPEFIDGLFLNGSSPSYSARHLVYLCSDGEWRRFQATDAQGAHFAVELNLLRIVTDGQEMFLLNVRRAGADRCL